MTVSDRILIEHLKGLSKKGIRAELIYLARKGLDSSIGLDHQKIFERLSTKASIADNNATQESVETQVKPEIKVRKRGTQFDVVLS